jgi:hypothetical protein
LKTVLVYHGRSCGPHAPRFPALAEKGASITHAVPCGTRLGAIDPRRLSGLRPTCVRGDDLVVGSTHYEPACANLCTRRVALPSTHDLLRLAPGESVVTRRVAGDRAERGKGRRCPGGDHPPRDRLPGASSPRAARRARRCRRPDRRGLMRARALRTLKSRNEQPTRRPARGGALERGGGGPRRRALPAPPGCNGCIDRALCSGLQPCFHRHFTHCILPAANSTA